MTNNSYKRSVKRERQLVNEARAEGLIACRSAGSHSPFDVWIVDHKRKEIRLIQVKTTKGARFTIVKDKKVYDSYTVIESTYSWE